MLSLGREDHTKWRLIGQQKCRRWPLAEPTAAPVRPVYSGSGRRQIWEVMLEILWCFGSKRVNENTGADHRRRRPQLILSARVGCNSESTEKYFINLHWNDNVININVATNIALHYLKLMMKPLTYTVLIYVLILGRIRPKGNLDFTVYSCWCNWLRCPL